MPLILYPIILIVAVIIFYILVKKSGTEKETFKTLDQAADTNKDVSIYADETDEEFLLRCYNFIINFFSINSLEYYVSNDNKSFKVVFNDKDTPFELNIECFYSSGAKYILFYAKINDQAIPDSKLIKVSELINRLNSGLILSTLQLNYEYRLVESILTYKIGNQPLIEQYFQFYFTSIISSSQTKDAFNRIINNNEEPALVALDFIEA